MTDEKKTLIKKLIKLADNMDRQHDYASTEIIDQAITTLAQQQDEEFDLEIPQDEKDVLDEVLKSLMESLQ